MMKTCGGFRTKGLAQFLKIAERRLHNPGYQRVAQELVNCESIVLKTFQQRTPLYDSALVAVGLGIRSGSSLQVFEYLNSLEHLVHRVGAEQVVVYHIQLVRVFPAVTLRPFLRVPDRAHRLEVGSRHYETGAVVLNEIRKRQIGCVLVAHVASHNEGESSHLGRPEYIGVRGGLGSPLHNALMHRPQLVHMVALVGTGTGVHKREHTGNQQGGFVVSDCEWTGENCASLPVLSLAVAEKEGIGCGIIMSQMTGLSHKTAGESDSVLH